MKAAGKKSYRPRAQANEEFDSVETSDNISRWVLQTIKRVSIQFRSQPAQVYGGVFHEVPPPTAGSGNGTRSESSVRERGHRIYTSLQKGNRVLQLVFHGSREGWGLRPILDLRVLNDSVMQLKFKMLTLRKIMPQIRSEDWFVTIDLKGAYFHISILPCHRRFLLGAKHTSFGFFRSA